VELAWLLNRPQLPENIEILLVIYLGTTLIKPAVMKGLMDVHSFIRLNQILRYPIFTLLWYIIPNVSFEFIIDHFNLILNHLILFMPKRQLTTYHNKDYNTKSPHIASLIIVLRKEYFRSHKINCSTASIHALVLMSFLFWKTEIN